MCITRISLLELDSPKILRVMDVGITNEDKESELSKFLWASWQAQCLIYLCFPVMQCNC